MQHCLFHPVCVEPVRSAALRLSTAAPSDAPSARRRALLAGIPALLAAPALYAQNKPVTTLTVPFPPGAGPDIAARLIGEKLAERLGHTVVVENKPGAGALIGAAAVARATADGTQLLLTPNTLVISPHVLPKGPNSIDPTRDLVPVSPLGITPMILVANPKLGVHNLGELLALLKKQPDLQWGSAGNGSPMHFAGAMLNRALGAQMLHVPYRGVAPSVTAVLGGEILLLFTGLGGSLQHLKSGKLLALAVAERRRSRLLPEVPTFAERGVAGVEVNAWYGLFAPAATPAAAVARLNTEVNAVLAMPEVRSRLEAAGIEVDGGPAQELTDWVRADFERYGRIARELQIKAD